MYFLRTITVEIFTKSSPWAIWWQHRQFLGRNLLFPWELQNCKFAELHEAAQYSALADTMRWCQKYSIMMPWLSAPAACLLKDSISLRPFVTKLQQLELPIPYECPSAEIQNKSAFQRQIPSPECIPHWPSHLFRTPGQFARQVKSKLKSTFIAALSGNDKKLFTAVRRQSIKLHSKFHLILIRQEQTSESQ